ncbi:MAG: serine--tRNA ligase, partial [Candidatus Heimdallarchaeota archaeon]
MLDIEEFRINLQGIIESEKKRFKDSTNAEKVLEYDNKWREVLQKLQDLRRKRNQISEQIGELRKKGENRKAEEAIKSSKEIKAEIDELDKKSIELFDQREKYRYVVGNILHLSVPRGETEEDNEFVRVVGEKPQFKYKPLSHVDLISLIDGANTKKASEIAGSRFYYLKGDIVHLNLALLKFALDKITSKGYIPMWTPFFTKHEIMKAAAELGDFEEQLYKIEGEDLYMIATSEQTLAAYHYNEIIDPEMLPLKYAGISSCFRREAGSHGKDTLGIFRVHRFEKVEQFIFCKPEESWDYHEELLTNSEGIFKELGLPYRIVNIASGELNDNAAKK